MENDPSSTEESNLIQKKSVETGKAGTENKDQNRSLLWPSFGGENLRPASCYQTEESVMGLSPCLSRVSRQGKDMENDHQTMTSFPNDVEELRMASFMNFMLFGGFALANQCSQPMGK
jgi:hypothetical protein